tara:strand:+ start:2562 stop:3569 length:1008 start_codon:yes stop_codon:yes gene_type:complete
MTGSLKGELKSLNQNIFYLRLHKSPRSNALPNYLDIELIDIPLEVNIYKSISIKVFCKLFNFFRLFEKRSKLIVEYDGNFIPIFCLVFSNLFFFKKYKIFLDCHVNSYIDINFYSHKTFIKLVVIYIFKYIFRVETLVHNKNSLSIIKNSIYCPSPFPKIHFSNSENKTKILDNDLLIISSMNKDEPIDEFIQTAKELDSLGYKVKITGDKNKLKLNIDEISKFFTGFLDRNEYLDLLQRSKIILAMTSRQYNLLFAPREALLNQKICIVNDSIENKEFYRELCFYSSPNHHSIIKQTKSLIKNDEPIFNKTALLDLIKTIDMDIDNFKKCLHIR